MATCRFRLQPEVCQFILTFTVFSWCRAISIGKILAFSVTPVRHKDKDLKFGTYTIMDSPFGCGEIPASATADELFAMYDRTLRDLSLIHI